MKELGIRDNIARVGGKVWRGMENQGCRIRMRSAQCKEAVRERLQDESGIGVVEIILVLVVLIALVLIFKEQLTSLVEDIFETITSDASSV